MSLSDITFYNALQEFGTNVTRRALSESGSDEDGHPFQTWTNSTIKAYMQPMKRSQPLWTSRGVIHEEIFTVQIAGNQTMNERDKIVVSGDEFEVGPVQPFDGFNQFDAHRLVSVT